MRKKLMFMLLAVALMTVNTYATEYYPIDVQTKTENGVNLIIKTFEVAPDEHPDSLVESDLSQNGEEYNLRDVLKDELPEQVERKAASKTVTVASETDNREDVVKKLAPGINYNDGRFSGQLALDENSIVIEATGSKNYSYTVKDTREFSGLARNDPALIPKTVQRNGFTLSLCDVSWSGDENEITPTYSAIATYQGTAYDSKPSGYLATATYSGEVSETVPGNIRYSLIYEAIPVPIVPESFDWSPVWYISGIALALLLLGTVAYFVCKRIPLRVWKRKNASVSMEDDQPAQRHYHALDYMKREADTNA